MLNVGCQTHDACMRTKPMPTRHHKAVLDGGRRAGPCVSDCIMCFVCVDAQQTTASHAGRCTTSAARSPGILFFFAYCCDSAISLSILASNRCIMSARLGQVSPAERFQDRCICVRAGRSIIGSTRHGNIVCISTIAHSN